MGTLTINVSLSQVFNARVRIVGGRNGMDTSQTAATLSTTSNTVTSRLNQASRKGGAPISVSISQSQINDDVEMGSIPNGDVSFLPMLR